MLLCVRIKCVPIKYIAFLLHPEGHAPCILQTVPVARTEPVFGRNNILNFNKRFIIIIISRYSFFFFFHRQYNVLLRRIRKKKKYQYLYWSIISIRALIIARKRIKRWIAIVVLGIRDNFENVSSDSSL